jgi:hypothetical protein
VLEQSRSPSTKAPMRLAFVLSPHLARIGAAVGSFTCDSLCSCLISLRVRHTSILIRGAKPLIKLAS